jgi:hypothetical protein
MVSDLLFLYPDDSSPEEKSDNGGYIATDPRFK